MNVYEPSGVRLSTERMVQALALIHGNKDAGSEAGKVSNMARSIAGLVQEKVQQSQTGRDFPTALQDLRDGIQNSTLLGVGPMTLQEQMLTVIRGMQMKLGAEQVLHQELAQHQALESFNMNECWRLTMDRYQQEARGEYGFENESGYLDGTFRGLAQSLEAARHQTQLTPQLLTQIHDTCVGNVIGMNFTMSVGDAGRLQTGMRNGRKNGFGLTEGRNMSPEGLQELQDKIAGGDNWFEIVQHDGKPKLQTTIKSARECEARVQGIINTYNDELAAAATDDEKYTAIARCCRDLEISHVYADGNARTIGFCLVNKLLVENQLPPVILENPNRFDGYSVAQLVDEMKEGAVNLACHCQGPVIANPQHTQGQSCQMLLEAAERVGRKDELLTAAGRNGNTAMITTALNENRAEADRIEPGELDYQAEMAVAHARHPNSEQVKNDFRNVRAGQLNAGQARDLIHKAMIYSHDRLRADQTGSQMRVDGWNQLLNSMKTVPAIQNDARLMGLIQETCSSLTHLNHPVDAVQQQFRQAAKAMNGPDLPTRETTSTAGKLRAFFKPNAPAPTPSGTAYVPGKGLS